jgi:hypothetical protein
VKNWILSNPRAKNPPMALAAALTALGDRQAALEAIHKAVDQRVSSIAWLKVTPEVAPLQTDEEFRMALTKMELN